jgi:hypothetical protein
MIVSRSQIAVVALLVALGGLSACGSDKQTDKLSGDLGPGLGGPAVSSLTALDLTKPDGSVIGSLGYDAAFFTPTGPTGTFQAALSSPAYGITIGLSHISGRPDTPCRFNAAVLARDAAYQIGDTGFRTNASGQDLYEVDLSVPGTYLRLYCAKLRENVGMQFTVAANSPDKVGWMQVHATLNSVRAQ